MAPPLQVPDSGALAVAAGISGSDGSRYEGAAVLRRRPHPLTRANTLQLGVPDDALGFRPRPGVAYTLRLEDAAGNLLRATASEVWLERVQTSWWFVLNG